MTIPKVGGNDRDAGVVEEICGYLTSRPSQSFFLFAGAGSGKTRTLVEVLRRMTGVEPHEAGSRFASGLRARGQSIRVITYTRNAVSVINGRLGENGLARASTIHAFCWDLISGFDEDIREELLEMNRMSLEKATADAEGRRRGATAKDIQIIADFEERAIKLRSTRRFLYNPDRNTYGEGALQHSQVLAVTKRLLDLRPTLRKTLADRHPVILIDESQDTMSGLLDSLLHLVDEEPSRLTLGLFGDHRQRIYMDGHKDLPSLIPRDWALPKLEMNHRCQQRIVDLINRIWAAELKGRTQPASGVVQFARTEKSGGTVRVFVGDTNLAPEEKIRREMRCAERMHTASGLVEWNNTKGGFQVLALEHKLAARRGGFLDVFNAMMLIDPEAARPQGNGENKGPGPVQILLDEIPALAACIDPKGKVDEFGAIEVLHRYGCLRDLPTTGHDQQARLLELHTVIQELADACSNPESSVREVLGPVVKGKLFRLDDRLSRAFHDSNPPPPDPARSSDEPAEDRRSRGFHKLFCSRWTEIQLYRAYMEGTSNLATHQVVKGSEFENVMVVMDDDEAGGFLFSYDKLFGAVPLTKTDEANAAEDKETTIDRTLRLLYVTCSRAKESLALVLWSSDPETAIQQIKAGGWFSMTEVEPIPEA
jgi:DNA helicase-2/ATP-dependent DNA helicase PcrA